MKANRTTRLLRLLQTLEGGGAPTAAKLAKACGVSKRTIFRDLDALRDAGVPIECDRKSGQYSIPGNFVLPDTNFTPTEALALIVLASEFGGKKQVPFYEAAQGAANKIESSLPASLREDLSELKNSIQLVPQGVADLSDKEAIYGQLLVARATRKVVRIEYESLTEWESITTKLRPYQLIYSKHSWYVVGRSSAHREVRTFKLSRISKLTPLDEKYALPRGFSLKRYLGNAWRMVPEEGRDIHAVIRFAPLVATNVAEVVWHPTQRLEPQPDGSLLFHATVSGVNEISWWILGYADQAEVLKPVRLRKLVAQRAKNLAKIYS